MKLSEDRRGIRKENDVSLMLLLVVSSNDMESGKDENPTAAISASFNAFSG